MLPSLREIAVPNYTKHTALTALALTVLAGMIFIVGTSRALAPDVALACKPEARELADIQASAVDSEPLDPAQRVLVEHLSRRFLIATEATQLMVGTAYRAAREVGLDPLLILAVISIESRFNPIAESVMGAKGLMQIIPKYHLQKLQEHGGLESVLDPQSNIVVGTQILQEYVHRTGTLEAGLQFYNGAMSDPTAQYAQKVMAERIRLEEMVRLAARNRSASNNNSTGT